MSEPVSAVPLNVDRLATDIDGVDALIELALDLRSSWHHGADDVWQQLNPELWRATQNPWGVLQTVSRDTLSELLSDVAFRHKLDEQLRVRRETAQAPAWFQDTHPQSEIRNVAYFSMEFMLSEALPIYSGGLGNVAGDQLKAANDLGVPVTGVGLLYQQGYFRQLIDPDGRQQAAYPYNDPGQLPIIPLRQANGEWLRLKLDLPGHSIWARAWQARVGRLKLYLLDTNDAANYPPYRGITSELYGGGVELRLMQEMVLGIGGWRLLAALGVEPDVCHLNEGHAAFLVLERARHFMAKTGTSFDVALSITRVGNVFTTHTAVPAGFDRFTPAQIEHCLGAYAHKQLGISTGRLMGLGRQDPTDASEAFNMAYLAIRGSGAVNGVSRLHGQVSRRLFAPLFPRWPADEVPVDHVTNGVHTPTWDSAPADTLWTDACGQDRWAGTTESLHRDIRCVSDEDLWAFRRTSSASLVDYVRERLSQQFAATGGSDSLTPLDPDTLTIGFARRIATYKRPDLLLHDPARLLRLLNHPERPLQVVIAGKAHPADAAGQALIRRWIEFTQLPEARGRVVFLSDYDMHLAEHLVQGVDVWLNTPRRPWEASGTSGMKVLVNGGINLSELDGWWAETYTPEVGWALGDGNEHGDDPARDAVQAEALYDLLEREVTGAFYEHDGKGVPRAWVGRMRESMSQLTPRFSANRAVREYTERFYLPAASAYHARAANDGKRGSETASWLAALDQRWPQMSIGEVTVKTVDQQHTITVQVQLGELSVEDVTAQLYADASADDGPVQVTMHYSNTHHSDGGTPMFTAAVPADRPATHYATRLFPKHAGVSVPLETTHIRWHR